MKNKSLLLVLSALMLAQNAFAHAAWVAPRLDQQTVIYGHGAEDNAYPGKTLSALTGLNQQGEKIELTSTQHEKNITLDTDEAHFAAAFVLDNGYWTKDKNKKWHNLPKNEVANADSAVHSIKTALAIFKEGAHFKAEALQELPLLLLPQSDAVATHKDKPLKIKVLFKGKPLPNVKITGDYVGDADTVSAITDEHGMAEIIVRNHGLNVLAVGHRVDLSGDDKADQVSYTATLSFNNANHKH